MEKLKATLEALGLSEEQINAILPLMSMSAPAGSDSKPAPVESAAPDSAAAGLPKPEEEEAKKLAKRAVDAEAAVKKAESEKADLAKRLDALEAERKLESINKRVDTLKWVPTEREKLVELLKRHGEDKDLVEILEKVNKAMQESPVFKQYGAGGAGDASDPVVKFEKMVDEFHIEATKRGEKLSRPQAYARVAQIHKAEYAAMQG